MVDYNYNGVGDEGPQADNSDLHKKFGRETDVGKLLYGLYGAKQKPKIEYPQVKTKPRVEQPKEVKPCPQKTVIEYPEAPRPDQKYHMIDFVPKRKAGSVILADIDADKRRPLGRAPGKMGQNRADKID
jgi:hypothetical protein